MDTELVVQTKVLTTASTSFPVPALVAAAGEKASRRFIEFSTANFRNRNTRAAYARAIRDFCQWCDVRGLRLETLEPVAVAAYVEQHLANRATKSVSSVSAGWSTFSVT